MMTITDIYETMNEIADRFFEWVQAHPKFGLLFVAILLALWLTGGAPVEMGVRVAVPRQTVVFRRLQAGNETPDSDFPCYCRSFG